MTFLAFAYFIVLDFQSFPQDEKYARVTFLTRLGWERVIPLHHIFVLFAYIFFLAMPAAVATVYLLLWLLPGLLAPRGVHHGAFRGILVALLAIGIVRLVTWSYGFYRLKDFAVGRGGEESPGFARPRSSERGA